MIKLTKNGILRIHFRYSPYNMVRLECNFNCSYCFLNNAKIKVVPFTKYHFHKVKIIWDDLAKIKDEIYVRVNFNGEILVDDWAKRCAFYISKIPNIKICEVITNNFVNPDTYLHKFNKTNTSFHCSFHPEFISLNKFLDNILKIKNEEFEVVVSLVCVPQIVKKIPKIFDFLKKHEINVKLMAFSTSNFRYLGKKYPKGYTVDERKILQHYFKSKEEFDYFIELKTTKGLDCYAGVDMINLNMDGTVLRCCTGEVGEYNQRKIDKIGSSYGEVRYYAGFYANLFLRRILKDKIRYVLPKSVNIKELISGRIKLEKEPYPCHENHCASDAHIIGLKEFRKKYQLSNKFVDQYVII